jgi:hypothetical protein
MLSNSPAFVTSILAVGSVVFYIIGRRLYPQLVWLSLVAFLSTGRRYKWLYILYKTLPRDLM